MKDKMSVESRDSVRVGRIFSTIILEKCLKVLGRLLIFGMIITILMAGVFRIANKDIRYLEFHPLTDGNDMHCLNRSAHVINVCAKDVAMTEEASQNDSSLVFNNILIDDRHKLFYCNIARVASTTFKSLLIFANTNRMNMSIFRSDKLPHETSVGIQHSRTYPAGKAQHYRKYIVVRHPWDRLLSTYKSLIVNWRKVEEEPYHVLINATFGDDVEYDNQNVAKLTVGQFLTLISQEYHNRFQNQHWMSYYDLCHPCRVHYDKIIKLETLESDIGDFMERLQYKNKTSPVHHHNTRRYSYNHKLQEVTRIFGNLPPDVVYGLEKHYERDFKLFGYSWGKTNAGLCSINNKGQECCQ